MLSAFRAAVLAAATTVLSVGSAVGQSLDLGSNSGSLSFGVLSGDDQLATVDGSLDFSITRYHGLQLDLGATNYEHFWMGHLAGHLYLQPQERAKYGVFLAYADANNEEATTTDFGFQGLWSVGQAVTVEGRLGVGRAGGESEIDYTFMSARGHWAVTEATELSAGIFALNVDERFENYANLRLNAGVRYAFNALPMSVSAGVEHSRISGTLDKSETRLRLGLSLDIGAKQSGPTPLSARTFAPVRPLRDLIEADVVWPKISARELRKQRKR